MEALKDGFKRLKKLIDDTAKIIKSAAIYIWENKWKIIAAIALLMTLAVFLWTTAVVLYALLYYSYMPIVHTEVPLYFDYKDGSSNPIAVVNRTHDFPPFYPGQKYSMTVELTLPESPDNIESGMFMVRLGVFSNSALIYASNRPCILRYHSYLLRVIKTFAFSFFLIFDWMREEQVVRVVLTNDFVDGYLQPANSISIELSKPSIQLYSATLYIDANLGFFRSILYRWFFTSAIVGISFIFALEWIMVVQIVIIVLLLSRKGSDRPRPAPVNRSVRAQEAMARQQSSRATTTTATTHDDIPYQVDGEESLRETLRAQSEHIRAEQETDISEGDIEPPNEIDEDEGDNGDGGAGVGDE